MERSYPDPKVFRAQLDAVLRQRDPGALRAFLVDQGQWAPETTTDPEAAMWMMIAASPAFSALHDEAGAWLTSHDHATEASAILGRQQPDRPPANGTANRGGRRRPGAPRRPPPRPHE